MVNVDREKLYHAVLGLAVGDALGVPAEFMSRNQLERKPITDMIGGGCWGQPAGTWSDDTAMTLATIDALNKTNWKLNDATWHLVMTNFVLWLKLGKFAAFNNRFDVGNTCKEAIINYNNYGDINNCGLGEGKCGNGALMRMVPALFMHDSAYVKKLSRLTHNNITCDIASLMYIILLDTLAFEDCDKFEAYDKMTIISENSFGASEFNRIISRNLHKLNKDDIKSTGYVVDTLEAAIWCFLNTDNYKD